MAAVNYGIASLSGANLTGKIDICTATTSGCTLVSIGNGQVMVVGLGVGA